MDFASTSGKQVFLFNGYNFFHILKVKQCILNVFYVFLYVYHMYDPVHLYYT